MKKNFKFLLTLVLFVVLITSLGLGVLRELEVPVKTDVEYFEYSAEGYDGGYRVYGDRYFLISGEDEIECQLEGNQLSTVVNEVKIDAILAEDLSNIEIVVDKGEGVTEQLILAKGTEVKTVNRGAKIIPSDYICNFLQLAGFEELIGEHYFNSIFCSISGGIITLFLTIILKKRDKPVRAKKDEKPNSLKSVTPVPVSIKINKK